MQKFTPLLIVLLHSYVSETQRRHALPSQAQRHILAGLASVVGGLSAPYEKASHVHERPVVNWLWAAGCHPFGPFSNTSHISQMLLDVALVNALSICQNAFYLPRGISQISFLFVDRGTQYMPVWILCFIKFVIRQR